MLDLSFVHRVSRHFSFATSAAYLLSLDQIRESSGLVIESAEATQFVESLDGRIIGDWSGSRMSSFCGRRYRN